MKKLQLRFMRLVCYHIWVSSHNSTKKNVGMSAKMLMDDLDKEISK